MCSLSNFPAPPPCGYVTQYEQNAELVAVIKSAVDQEQTAQSLGLPLVNISADTTRPSFSKETARSAFLEPDQTPSRRIIRAWYEHGVVGVLEELAGHKGESWYTVVAGGVLALVRCAQQLHGSLLPHLSMSNEAIIAEFAVCPNWSDSYIRCFAWHPHTQKFAISLRDDCIKVYMSKRPDVVPLLKHKMQRGVADLAWKPLSASLLAVACQSCVLLWSIDPTSLATRPSTSCVQVLSVAGHTPVTMVSWCPQGGPLLTSSPTDTSIMAWDVSTEQCTPLRRVGGGGVCLLKWSPDGSKLFSGCPSRLFRVWESRMWTCEQWTKLSGRVQTACWSPNGNLLLFTLAEEPIIYQLTFSKVKEEQPGVGGSKMAVPAIDLTQVELDTGDENIVVGGLVQNMAWDPSGERLAIQFKGGTPELIALFQTRIEPSFEVIPCGFIRGRPGLLPQLINFHPNFAEGALLTVVWSDGEVSYIPLYFVHRDDIHQNGFRDNIISGHMNGRPLYTLNASG